MIKWMLIIMLLTPGGEPVQQVQLMVQEDECRSTLDSVGQGGRFNLVLRADGEEQRWDAQLLYCAWSRDGKFEGFVKPEAALTQ